MSDGIYAATSGALAQLQQLDSVSNNLANANTVGFKRQGLVFHEVMVDQELKHTNVATQVTQLQQGGFTKTDRGFDVALSGPGMLAVQTIGGERYTRAGHLSMNADGHLVNPDGALVLDRNQQSIKLNPQQKYDITRGGDIVSEGQTVASLRIVDVKNPEAEGASLFKSQVEPLESKTTTLEVGHLESSNVNAVEQMTKLIEINRLYDATMNAIRTYNEIDSKTANEMTR